MHYGTEWPTFAFTRPTSEAFISPSTLRSSRKLPVVTGTPTCPLTCATSEAFTVLLPVVSPRSMFALTGVSGRTEPKQSVTLLKVTVICCTSETPVKFTVIAFPACGGRFESKRKLYKVPKRMAFALQFCANVSELQLRAAQV